MTKIVFIGTRNSDISNTWLSDGSDVYNSSSEHIGIGMSQPQHKLDVSGTTRLIGNTTICGSVVSQSLTASSITSDSASINGSLTANSTTICGSVVSQSLTTSSAIILGSTTICGTLYVSDIFGVTVNTEGGSGSSQWSDSPEAEKIYYSGMVAIGKDIPSKSLDVSGDAQIASHTTIQGNTTICGSTIIQDISVNGQAIIVGSTTICGTLFVSDISGISFGNTSKWNDSIVLNQIYYDGSVGIGNTVAYSQLDVSGSANMSNNLTVGSIVSTTSLSVINSADICGTLTVGNIICPALGIGVSGEVSWSAGSEPNEIYYNGNVGIGNDNPSYPLDVTGDIHLTNAFLDGSLSAVSSSLSAGLTVNGLSQLRGNVAVGKTSASVPLDVSGSAQISGNLTTESMTSGTATISSLTTSSASLRGTTTICGSMLSQDISASSVTVLGATTICGTLFVTDISGINLSSGGGGSSQWTDSTQPSRIYYGGYVGIGVGMVNPTYTLDISGDLNVKNIYADNIKTSESVTIDISNIDGVVQFGNKNTLYIDPSLNRVGIGKSTAPTTTLDVAGDMTICGTLYVDNISIGGDTAIDLAGADQSLKFGANSTMFIDIETSRVGIATSTPGSAFDVNGNVSILDKIKLGSSYIHRWGIRNAPSAKNWKSVCYSPQISRFVAVSSSTSDLYNIAVSTTGANWTSVLGIDVSLNAVCWSSDLQIYVTVGSSNKVLSSSNGTDWVQSGTLPSNNNWTSICWSPELSMFVAVSSTGTIRSAYSYDSSNWVAGSGSSTYGAWKSVCWSPELSMFVAVGSSGSDQISTSTNGIAWTSRYTGSTDWNSVTWSSKLSMFVAVGSVGTNPHVITSYNGTTWTLRVNDSNIWNTVCWSDELNLFVALGESCAMSSPNGITWTSRTITDGSWNSVVWTSELSNFVAVGSTGTTSCMLNSVLNTTFNLGNNDSTTDFDISGDALIRGDADILGSTITYGDHTICGSLYINSLTTVNIVSLIGQISYFPAKSAPNGWIKCNGSTLQKASYPVLYSVLVPKEGNASFYVGTGGVGIVEWNSHGLSVGDIVRFVPNTGGVSLPTSMVVGSPYYVSTIVNSNRFNITSVDGYGFTTGISVSMPDAQNVVTNTFNVYNAIYPVSLDTFGVPDLRGEFIRCWSDNRSSVDANRPLGTFQEDLFKSHTHTVTDVVQGDFIYGNDQDSYFTRQTGDWYRTITTSATGGSETRPRNIALLACIKY